MTEETNPNADIEFVEYIVKQLVSNPGAVVVARKVDEMGVLITLEVAPDDMGRIIGKGGQTAKAIRVLLRVIGSKNHARVNLKIIEPQGGSAEFKEERKEEAIEEAPKEEEESSDE